MLPNRLTIFVLLVFVADTETARPPTLRPTSCNTHPCLFYDPEDVPRLRLQAQTTHKIIATEIISAVKNDGKYSLIRFFPLVA